MVFNGRADAIAPEAEAELKFSNERGFSGDYIKSRAVIELKRLLSTKGASNV